MKQESKLRTLVYDLANRLMPDSIYTRLKYKRNLHHWPNLRDPKTFDEKLNWLKLHRHEPLMTKMVDKADVKDYVANIIGEEYIIPTYGLWTSADDIDFSELPEQFVMKGTHDSGRVIVCADRSTLNEDEVRMEMRKSLKRDFYAITREWPYKNVPHRIIAEKYIQQSDGGLTDYKFYCFDGYVDCVMVCLDRHIGDTKFYFFDKEWNLLRLNKHGLEAPVDFTIHRPKNLDRMFNIASKLSKGQPFVRVDLYNVDGEIYFGECTFYPNGGVEPNRLPEADQRWSQLLCLKNNNTKK